MADWLLLRLPRIRDEPASWLVVDARGTPVGPLESGPLTAAVTRTAGRRVWVIVPGTDVLLAEPEVPVKAGLKLQQLVPYALEEQLADNIEDLHFAIGKRASDSIRAPVAVVARALLDEWLATLRSSGIEPEAIHAESDLLPGNPAHAVVLLEEDAVFVRAPGAAPVTLPAPGEPVSFDAHIKPLFRDRDRQSMSFAFDLSSADDVRTHAAGILQRLQDGTMPCDGAWPADQIAVFERWTVTGMEP